MLTKLHALYPNSLLFDKQPANSIDGYYLFADCINNEWIAIPQSDISNQELKLLQTLYEWTDPGTPAMAPLAKTWHDFLYLTGQPPHYEKGSQFRFIQFAIKGTPVETAEIEQAFNGFFPESVIFVWENSNSGVIIEQQQNHKLSFLPEKDLHSMAEILESDFYVKILFYIGKPFYLTSSLPAHFKAEREYFHFGQTNLTQVKIFAFEKIFPAYLAAHLPAAIQEKLNQTIAEAFTEDPEMLRTIKVFLENNLNASLTAKKLYIHRNTLQYRLEKFSDKTGIQLKDFYSAFTVFLGCLIFDKQEAADNLPK